MVHFDEAEVQEIGLGDTDYPQLLRAIRKPPKVLRFRGSLPPNTKIIAISGSRKPTKQAALQTAYKIGKMLAQNTDTPLSPVSPKVATLLLLKARSPQAVTLWVSSHADSKHWDPVKENCPKKSSLPAVLSFLNILTTSQNSGITICEETRSLRGLSEKTIIITARERSGSSATANRALRQGREVIITPHVKAKIEGTTIIKNLGELKDTLGIARLKG